MSSFSSEKPCCPPRGAINLRYMHMRLLLLIVASFPSVFEQLATALSANASATANFEGAGKSFEVQHTGADTQLTSTNHSDRRGALPRSTSSSSGALDAAADASSTKQRARLLRRFVDEIEHESELAPSPFAQERNSEPHDVAASMASQGALVPLSVTLVEPLQDLIRNESGKRKWNSSKGAAALALASSPALFAGSSTAADDGTAVPAKMLVAAVPIRRNQHGQYAQKLLQSTHLHLCFVMLVLAVLIPIMSLVLGINLTANAAAKVPEGVPAETGNVAAALRQPH